jgi:hypothetical protein
MMDTQTLYRPVGLKEMELILETGCYPPRLKEQPIFYPVLNFDYAAQIASRWNTKDPNSGYLGLVTAFDIDSVFVGRYKPHTVGAAMHRELWVPAEELTEFNTHICGDIRIEAVYYGDQYTGRRDWLLHETIDEKQ